MTLTAARKLAERIQEELAPLCHECVIAGSIRRRCSVVNDIDLVIIPQDQYTVRARVLRNATPIQDGPVNLLVRLQNDIQLDIFFARPATQDLLDKRPTNLGSLMLCRTGSREHNIKLATRAETLGLKWRIYEGLVDLESGLLVASVTEEDMFRALKMDFIKPEDRK